jgi:hypothetical protein
VTETNCSVCHADEAARFMKPSAHSARFECGGCHAEVSPMPGPGHRAIEACQSCHPDRETHAPTGPPGLPCTQCHDPHGTGNVNLVLDVLTTIAGTQVPIQFDNYDGRADGSFASASAPGTGICEVCHTTTRFYRADGTGASHFTFSCLPCHLHAEGSGRNESRLLVLLALARAPHHAARRRDGRDAAAGATYAGNDVCVACHEEQATSFAKTIHALVLEREPPESDRGCEACHGPAARTPRPAAARASAGSAPSCATSRPRQVGGVPPLPRRRTSDRHDFLRGEHALANVAAPTATPATAASAMRCSSGAYRTSATAATRTCARRSDCPNGTARASRRRRAPTATTRTAARTSRASAKRTTGAASNATTTSRARSCSSMQES